MDEVNKDTEFINILNKSAEDYILTKGYTNLILDNSKLEITIKEKIQKPSQINFKFIFVASIMKEELNA